MSFFKAKDGSYYPVSRIHKITPARMMRHSGGEKTVIEAEVIMDGGGSTFGVDVSDVAIDDIIQNSMPHFTAAPGCFVLAFHPEGSEDGGPLVERHPIQGWRVSRYGGLVPLVVDNTLIKDHGLGDAQAILHANGEVEDQHENRYASEDGWRQSLIAVMAEE
ncbi:hypothetical protein [Novosphingobium sp. AP12]|uniref:hypothetical protein n=1 Tax=Novosphingobium sp. AP12 TaxID=1144305 RepID=UPI00027205D5|nr:hypothetical protein [Novosphingobium sp. AP12]EJL23953.1 hypothetical protein PMI02_03873 [Novosphingobium sp. AP12]